MTAHSQFLLPDVGEGLTEAEILTWRVAPGDTVQINDIIVEIETAKAAVELPCPFAGTVAALLVAEGDVVEVGTPIIEVRAGVASDPEESTSAPDTGSAVEPAAASEEAPAATSQESSTDDSGAVLVGYGVTSGKTPKRRSRRTDAQPQTTETPGQHVLAKPPVRLLAKELGVDLNTVRGTGAGGIITRKDVQAAAGMEHSARSRAVAAAFEEPLGGVRPESASQAREERIPIRGVIRTMAEAMTRSHAVPQATAWLEVDVTRSVKLLPRLQEAPGFSDIKVSPLLLVSAAVVRAVERYPEINATWDEASNEIVRKHYINLGIAVSSQRGLLVPVIKDAQDLTPPELAQALNELIGVARAGKTKPEDMQGGTISITNIGAIGLDGGTPMLNPGQSAIIAMGRIAERPWVVEGEIKPRQVMQLSITLDHRIIDGALGARVLTDVANFLHDPALALWASDRSAAQRRTGTEE